MSMDVLKERACYAIDNNSGILNELSQTIWKNPELAFKEFHAHDKLTKFLDNSGFQVEKSFKLETAFRATYSTNDNVAEPHPNIAFLCEYDALPGIGHACGHNLIAEVGVAAALGVQAALQSRNMGTLSVIGCPAEEGLCGKADLIRLGAFEGVDVAMMAHPSQTTLAKPKYVSMTPLSIKYHGQTAHASSYPWEGVNALDAAVMCYNNISCLRQQMKPTWRVHGVIKNGGLQPNIIPEETELEFYIRTPTDPEMVTLKEKVAACVQAAALATGCTVDYKFGEKAYSNLLSNNTLAALFETNATSIGVKFETNEEKKQKFGGSTDMGNLSHVIPSIHPKFYIGTMVSNHSPGFTEASGSETAQKYTLDVAKALAMMAIDIYMNPKLLKAIRSDFHNDLKMQC